MINQRRTVEEPGWEQAERRMKGRRMSNRQGPWSNNNKRIQHDPEMDSEGRSKGWKEESARSLGHTRQLRASDPLSGEEDL